MFVKECIQTIEYSYNIKLRKSFDYVITQTRIDNIWRKKLSEKIPTVEFCAMVCFFLVWNRVSYRCSFPLPEFTFLCYQKILEIFKNSKKILKGSYDD